MDALDRPPVYQQELIVLRRAWITSTMITTQLDVYKSPSYIFYDVGIVDPNSTINGPSNILWFLCTANMTIEFSLSMLGT